jgi:DHA1 family tetracycline resistance protein-like MFS transporter
VSESKPLSNAKLNRSFVAAGMILAIEAFAYALVLPLLPIALSNRVPWWAIGVLLAGYSVVQFVALGPISRAAERHGARPIVIMCLLGTALGLALTAVSLNFWVLLAGRLIDGVSAGTVVVVTAATLTQYNSDRWTTVLGRLGAIRGAAALTGIVITAALGVLIQDPEKGLQIMAATGAILAVLATLYTRHLPLTPIRDQSPDHLPVSNATRKLLVHHTAAQAGQAGLLALAPALALTVATQTTALVAPAATIVGLAVGQLAIAPLSDRKPAVGTSMIGVLVIGLLAVTFTPTVLAGLAIAGIAMGTFVPSALARAIASRVADGATDLSANALAGRASIVGQIAGPLIGYTALTGATALASATLAIFGIASARKGT